MTAHRAAATVRYVGHVMGMPSASRCAAGTPTTTEAAHAWHGSSPILREVDRVFST